MVAELVVRDELVAEDDIVLLLLLLLDSLVFEDDREADVMVTDALVVEDCVGEDVIVAVTDALADDETVDDDDAVLEAPEKVLALLEVVLKDAVCELVEDALSAPVAVCVGAGVQSLLLTTMVRPLSSSTRSLRCRYLTISLRRLSVMVGWGQSVLAVEVDVAEVVMDAVADVVELIRDAELLLLLLVLLLVADEVSDAMMVRDTVLLLSLVADEVVSDVVVADAVLEVRDTRLLVPLTVVLAE